MARLFRLGPHRHDFVEKELEALSYALERERLDRREEVERLKIETEALKRALEEISPGFREKYNRAKEALILGQEKSESTEEHAIGAGE